MESQSTIIIIIAAGLFLVIVLFVKNQRDRKKLIKPHSDDPVEETHIRETERKDQV